MKVRIDAVRCQGHGRCYDLTPRLFREDDEGFGKVVGDGTVGADVESGAWLAEANCPEAAIAVDKET